MKEMLLTAYEQMEVTEVNEPEVGPDDVLIQVEACGICGSLGKSAGTHEGGTNKSPSRLAASEMVAGRRFRHFAGLFFVASG